MCVGLFVGQEKCASEKQPSKSDPWTSFAAHSEELPKRVMDLNFFSTSAKKGTYLDGHGSPFCDWAADLSNSGSRLFAVSLQNLCHFGRLLLFFPPSFLSPGTNPYPKACSHLQDVLSFIPCPE